MDPGGRPRALLRRDRRCLGRRRDPLVRRGQARNDGTRRARGLQEAEGGIRGEQQQQQQQQRGPRNRQGEGRPRGGLSRKGPPPDPLGRIAGIPPVGLGAHPPALFVLCLEHTGVGQAHRVVLPQGRPSPVRPRVPDHTRIGPRPDLSDRQGTLEDGGQHATPVERIRRCQHQTEGRGGADGGGALLRGTRHGGRRAGGRFRRSLAKQQ
mmetsp:Transcript_5684/g.13139  ORF Transcript_5684/g.13139 Transcript_5684/m.13139 type:complete len:209 (+) Transcript_5684:910-1536(+)